ncbi:recombinase family protein [Paenibacillus chitinolyticus]|uniref:recombinase family protein n=1 Tax=Paenibacillus chitinolyticus TaxID=79263 RepID=UPI003670C7C8
MYSLPPGKYCAYWRKSRADREAEARGEEDVYVRHERIIMELSKRYGVIITEIYRERPLSGEKIAERPEMIRLLADVENEEWAGVFVVEVERLARGDTMDQGLVAQTFKFSNTLIVTPMRTYDPTNPDDEEYFEFGLFMSRREFKTITRRLQGGRVSAVKEGKYVGNIPPFGYNRVKLRIGYSLEPHPQEAEVVKLIYSLYTHDDPKKRMGTDLIAQYLNEKNIPSAKGTKWIVATVNRILRNKVYAGYVHWGSRPVVKRRTGFSRPNRDHLSVKGIHPPLIEEKVYDKAQEIMNGRNNTPGPRGIITNPLAGLIRCDMCGGPILYRPSTGSAKARPPLLLCTLKGCPNKGSYVHVVEERLIISLKAWLKQYKARWEEKKPRHRREDESRMKVFEQSLEAAENRMHELNTQKGSLHDLLERKVYTIDDFIERSKILADRMDEAKAEISRAQDELTKEKQRMTARVDIIPQLEYVLDAYYKTDDPADKNNLLKTILAKATYRKEKGGRWNPQDQFELKLYPILPTDH